MFWEVPTFFLTFVFVVGGGNGSLRFVDMSFVDAARVHTVLVATCIQIQKTN